MAEVSMDLDIFMQNFVCIIHTCTAKHLLKATSLSKAANLCLTVERQQLTFCSNLNLY